LKKISSKILTSPGTLGAFLGVTGIASTDPGITISKVDIGTFRSAHTGVTKT
jgi:hypothetical protein